MPTSMILVYIWLILAIITLAVPVRKGHMKITYILIVAMFIFAFGIKHQIDKEHAAIQPINSTGKHV